MKKIKSALAGMRPRNFIILTLAGIINAFGVTLFLFPAKLYDSGISGVSMLLDRITPPALTLSLFLIILNIPVFLFGMKRQGVQFTVYSVFTVAVYSVMSFLILNVLPIDIAHGSPLAGTDILLCAVFGGTLSGIGSGLTIRYGAALDGVDVLSVIFAKRIGISFGTFVLVFNVILYIICGFIMKSWILPLYSILTYFIGSKPVDFVVEGFDRSKCAMIVTTKSAAICQALSENFSYSGTIISAVGGYSGEEKQIILFITNRFQVNRLRTIVYSIDADAFISLQDVTDVIKKELSE